MICDPLGFYGLRIVVDSSMADRVQFRYPRSKRRRIRNKWAKRPQNWKTVPWDRVYQMGDVLMMHPAMAEKLRREASSHVRSFAC